MALLALVLTLGLGKSAIEAALLREAVSSIRKFLSYCNTNGLAVASKPGMGARQS